MLPRGSGPGHRRGASSTSSSSSTHSLGLLSPRQPWGPSLRLLRPLLPSFVADALLPDHHHHHSKTTHHRLHATSYLDGLRGIAALLVFVCHYTENNFRPLTRAYSLVVDEDAVFAAAEEANAHGAAAAAAAAAVGSASSGGGGNATAAVASAAAGAVKGGLTAAAAAATAALPSSSWIQLPFVRVIFSGRPMVHIFFVISGFVLAYKPVRALHARDTETCYAALASSAFRRGVRLYGPCVVSTFLIMVMRQMGWLEGAEDTWTEELWKWKGALLHGITWPWAWDMDLRPAYDVHLWTIPIEFAHSMLLFMVVLGLSRVRLGVRMASVFGLMMYCLACGKWAGFEFLTGLFLAEVHVLRTARAKKEWEGEGEGEDSRGLRGSTANWPLKGFQIALVVLGLFLAGWPNRDADKTPGIRYFLAQTPFPFTAMGPLAPQKFWFGLSAVATVWAVGDLGFLRRLFDSPLAQYCGRISYAVYICHGPVEDLFKEWLIGHPIVAASGEFGAPDYTPALPARGIKGLVGVETATQMTVSWFLGLWLLGPMVIWAADVFWRAVDNQIVTLARRLETLCLDDTEPSPRNQGYSVAA